MDTRRFLNGRAAVLAALVTPLAGCAPLIPAQAAAPVVLAASQPDTLARPAPTPVVAGWIDAAVPIPGPQPEPEPEPSPPTMITSPTPVPGPVLEGRAALVAANGEARARSRSDSFVGGVQVFAWSPGRVFEIWTAPLRVTVLTLAPGEAVTALAAGDTVRWQIAESASSDQVHVLIKPLEAGLETNLVLTTTDRVYLIHLRSTRASEGFNAAVAWDAPVRAPTAQPAPSIPPAIPHILEAVTPRGPVNDGYVIRPRGRAPDWNPTAVVDDGVRTFIRLPPHALRSETPALFILTASGEAELVNYRQVEGVLVVDRLFDQAELRLGDRRPAVVRLVRDRRP